MGSFPAMNWRPSYHEATARSNAETLKALIAQLKAFFKFNDTTLPTQVLISVGPVLKWVDT
jgi:hypothetical protein